MTAMLLLLGGCGGGSRRGDTVPTAIEASSDALATQVSATRWR